MLKFFPDLKENDKVKVLCLGAHSDDIEIGCGGTILKIIEHMPQVSVDWIVFSASPARREEAINSASEFLNNVHEKEIIIKNFEDGFFPYNGAEIKSFFEDLKNLSPDIIFTHYRHDLHQDHRLLCDLTWNTFRDHFILEYEIPKYDGDLGTPNFFVHLPSSIYQRKVDSLLKHFGTQENKHWFTPETFRAILRLRGIESRAPEMYAEAFHCRKLTWGI
ncbi:MAG: PIG-L family deacetylase [Ardenticatenaceae bacterium]|nr:PIG-L family deacetylase [Ardenticatenaceae bacterium]